MAHNNKRKDRMKINVLLDMDGVKGEDVTRYCFRSRGTYFYSRIDQTREGITNSLNRIISEMEEGHDRQYF